MYNNECDAIVDVGGGKIIDSAKRDTMELENVRTVIIPTSAAFDAPCTANTCIHDEHGTFIRAEKPKENPSVVVIDTEIIANAPVRLLISGIGDTFVTYYEARANRAAGIPNLSRGECTQAGFAMRSCAEMCC